MSGETHQAHAGAVTARLSIMMFLQFFVWGSWYVSMTGWISAVRLDALTADAYSVGPIAAIISPFFLGLVADRFFASQRVLAVMHLLGGLFLLGIPTVALTAGAGAPTGFLHPFILMLLGHTLCFMPTLGLTNTLAFHNITDQEKQFPLIRVFGTIGWIVGNIAVSWLPGGDKSPAQFYLAGGAALLLSAYSLTLPHTPPPMAGKQVSAGDILGLKALRLLSKPSYFVFILCSFLICIPLAGYYAQARNYVEATGAVVNGSATFTMSFGQMSEIFFMLIMPLMFARLGVKNMLLAGMAAWVLRYGLFAAAAENKVFWMVLGGVVLHGICYDFFFVTGMIYVDKKAPPAIRNQAQGFLVLVTQGLGLGIGAKLFFAHVVRNSTVTSEGVTEFDWYSIWFYPAVFAGVILVLFFVTFWDRVERDASEGEVAADRQLEPTP